MSTTVPTTPAGIVTKASRYSVTETLERLENVLRAQNLTIFAHIDHSGAAEHVGLSMQSAHVVIFGSPKAGTPLMIASPLLALDLPLKALIWQGDVGMVWVSYYSPAYLAKRYGIPDDLVQNIAGLDTIIATVLQG